MRSNTDGDPGNDEAVLEVGGWRLEVGGGRWEVGGGRLEVGGWRLEVGRNSGLGPGALCHRRSEGRSREGTGAEGGRELLAEKVGGQAWTRRPCSTGCSQASRPVRHLARVQPSVRQRLGGSPPGGGRRVLIENFSTNSGRPRAGAGAGARASASFSPAFDDDALGRISRRRALIGATMGAFIQLTPDPMNIPPMIGGMIGA